MKLCAAFIAIAVWVAPFPGSTQAPPDGALPAVALLRLPDGGIQPQVAVDDRGVAHVVFFKGEPGGGDLYYARLDPERRRFSPSVRLNSVAGSAIATGSVRGAQLAVGRDGRVHVAWNGAAAAPGGGTRHPMLYSRSTGDGASFAPQRDLLTWTSGIDGGGTIAADRAGHVFVAWHARGLQEGEANRTVYVARSRDDGATFGKEEQASPAAIGACACCGMRGVVDSKGHLNLIYRAATDGTGRDTVWVVGDSHRLTFAAVPLHPWRLSQCPMSTFALAVDGDRLLAAWETNKQIYMASLDPAGRTFSSPVSMTGEAPRRLPSVAINDNGERLVTWAEGTAWARGGTVAWQLYDREGRQLAARSDAGTVPVWGLVAAIARRDGSFVILH
jgi:hypothetical protein